MGIHKDFHFGERVVATFGADVDNLFNHPLLSPDNDYGGGGGSFAFLGDFNVGVDPVHLQTVLLLTMKVILVPDATSNRLRESYKPSTQEGVDSRRTIRLRLRITF